MLTVITGPPCSGKTTYLRQHALPGHLVVDFDAIAQALGSRVTHDHGQALREAAGVVWSAAVREAIRQHGKGRHAWVIDSRPSPWRAGQYAQAGARLVALAAPAAELHRRASEAGRPESWHPAIDQFLAGGEPEPRPGTRW
jgi:hypothetical protein